MADYKMYDPDICSVINQAGNGNNNVVELAFSEPIEAINIHKDDIIHLAKRFGLVVFESNSKL